MNCIPLGLTHQRDTVTGRPTSLIDMKFHGRLHPIIANKT